MRTYTRKGLDRRQKSRKNGGNVKAFLLSPYFKILAAVLLIAAIAGGTVFMHYYNRYATIIDRRLSGEIFQNTAKIYATPYLLYPGQRITPDQVVLRLRRGGLEPRTSEPSEDGVYQVISEGERSTIVVSPEGLPDYRLEFGATTLRRIAEVLTGIELPEIELPPELVTNLFDDTRTKRRLLEYEQLPPHLVDAIIASEDQRFYRHFGIDLIRAAGAFVETYIRDRQRQGASTLTMQVAGSFFLNRRDRTWSRKLPEIFMALILEQRLTKQQILTLYANEMYLGNRGTFAIHGFGEAAAAYFGKDVSELTVGEAATLVGMLPAPSVYSPRINPERAAERRNLVLDAMYGLDMINLTELEEAKQSDIQLAAVTVNESDAPYMVDFIREQLLADFSEADLVSGGLEVYTTLDPDLQKAAVEAVASGLAFVDEQLEARGRGPSSGRPPVQAALVALDPHTGEIKAMVGGRDYGNSQYNRITEAFRQPGSIFKPFVYAAAFETAFNPVIDPPEEFEQDPEGAPAEEEGGPAFRPTALRVQEDPTPNDADGLIMDLDLEEIPERDERGTIAGASVITPLTTVMDEPTLFFYEEDKYYEPGNFADVFYGIITAREALQRSLNVPTVKIAERIGYERVAELAHRVGMNADIRPYPSIALGAFEVTPIEVAGAYTALANEGVRVEPRALRQVTDSEGRVLGSYSLESNEVLRPEVAYVMTNLLENVINAGTGAGVRSRGFRLPAAGKTGTSRDGWFAGYTKDLLTIAWVGFDDNRELDLEGSRSALPIWTAFMLKAYELYPAREEREMNFLPPPGVEMAAIDMDTLSLATPGCENQTTLAFIYGTAPETYCPIHRFGGGFFLSDALRRFGRTVTGIFN